MGAITGTKTSLTPTELAGDLKIAVLTAPVATADDAITIAVGTHGITTIVGVMGAITGGQDAAFCEIEIAHTSTVITVTSIKANGSAADDFTGTTIELWVLGY